MRLRFGELVGGGVSGGGVVERQGKGKGKGGEEKRCLGFGEVQDVRGIRRGGLYS